MDTGNDEQNIIVGRFNQNHHSLNCICSVNSYFLREKKKKNGQCVRDNAAILHLVALIAILNLSILLFKAYHITLPSFSEAPALLVQCARAWHASNLALFIGSKLLKLYKFYCFKATAAPCCTVHCWLCSPLKHRCLQTQPHVSVHPVSTGHCLLRTPGHSGATHRTVS